MTPPRIIKGTELVVAHPVHVMARGTQTLLDLKPGERLIVDSDFGGLVHGHLPDRVIAGQAITVSLGYRDLPALTRRDGRPAQIDAAVIGRGERGYLQNRALLEFWDMA